MKSLRSLRLEKGWKQSDIQKQTGITQDWISEIERGLTSPSLYTRKKLEILFSQKINWLAVPVIRTASIFPTTWLECEREFKCLLRYAKGLPMDEKIVFIETIIIHLKNEEERK